MKVTSQDLWAELKEPGSLVMDDIDEVSESLGIEFTMPEETGDESVEDIQALARKSIHITPERLRRQRNTVWKVLITEWNLGIALPSEDISSCGKIPSHLGLKLIETVNSAKYQEALRLRPDPKAGGSSSSNGSSRAGRRNSRAG